MALSRNNWVAIAIGLTTVALTGLVNIGIREWYAPDLRYEEGRWYKSGQTAITSLRLANRGRTTVEDLRITTQFPERLSDIATSDPGLLFKAAGGGIGQKFATGTVERLVPGETLYVYFAMESPALLPQSESIVSSIVFNGGLASRGEPGTVQTWLTFMMGIGALGVAIAGTFLTRRDITNVALNALQSQRASLEAAATEKFEAEHQLRQAAFDAARSNGYLPDSCRRCFGSTRHNVADANVPGGLRTVPCSECEGVGMIFYDKKEGLDLAIKRPGGLLTISQMIELKKG